jgi:hypothetical protein
MGGSALDPWYSENKQEVCRMVVKALNEFQSLEFFKIKEPGSNALISRGPGEYLRETRIQGNAILSTLYVESIDPGASVLVQYFETTTAEFDGETLLLAEHPLQTTAKNPPSKIAVSRIHNKPICKVTVSGGNAVFGVYGTVVSSTASDIDDALVQDGEDFDQEDTQGMPMACYDPLADKMFLLRCLEGTIPVSLQEIGDAIDIVSIATSTPGLVQELVTTTVPAGKNRFINKVRVVCRGYACWTLKVNGDIIGSGRNSPANEQPEMIYTPRYKSLPGDEIKLEFLAFAAKPAVPVEAYLMGSDVSI